MELNRKEQTSFNWKRLSTIILSNSETSELNKSSDVIQGIVQMPLKHCQSWDTHLLSRKAIPGLHHLLYNKSLLMSVFVFVLMHLWSQILPLANQRGAHLLPLHFPAFGSCREEQGCCPSSSFTPKYKPVTPAAPHGTCLHWTHPPLVVGPQCSQHSRWDHTVAKYSILVLL